MTHFNTTHGHAGGRNGAGKRDPQSPEYRRYVAMKTRCYNKKQGRYHRYGGRGIVVCDRWLSGDGLLSGFECFLSDMGPIPSAKHTTERKDNDGNYEPGNCHWATYKEQGGNQVTNKIVIFRGEQMTLSSAMRHAPEGLRYNTAIMRMRRGETPDTALTRPANIR